MGVRVLVGRQPGLDEAALGLPDHIVLDGEAVPEPRSAQGQTEIRARPFDQVLWEGLVCCFAPAMDLRRRLKPVGGLVVTNEVWNLSMAVRTEWRSSFALSL